MLPEEFALGRYTPAEQRPGVEDAAPARSQLVERIRADVPGAFDELFECYSSMVFHLAYRMLGDREEALDVSQEVFFSIYRKLHRFRGESSLKTWIYRIAVNRASNRHRWWNRLRRRGTVSLDEHLSRDRNHRLCDTLPACGASPEANLLAEERSAQLGRSLLRLPMHQRIAVIMRDIEGLSYEEIAEATEASLGTVKSRIARGRDELKRQLNGALEGSGPRPDVVITGGLPGGRSL